MNFGMDIVINPKLLIFFISRSKVIGQGHKYGKICLFWAISLHWRAAWVRLGLGRVRWGTFGSLPTFFGMLPKAIEQYGMPYRMVSSCWQVANVIGNVPIPQEEGVGLVEIGSTYLCELV